MSAPEVTVPSGAPEERWLLRLYVAGSSPKSLDAFVNLQNLCEAHLADRYEIEVVDLIEQPGRARSDDILAIPTLVRRQPPPLRKVIGDLSDTQRVLENLRLRPRTGRGVGHDDG